MTRVAKFIDIPLTTESPLRESVGAASYALSGYPGVMYSNDDFYVLSSGLVVTETSNDNDNKTLWKVAAQPEEQVPEWIRNMVANRMATNGKQWADTFVRYNNGLYNNQFMIVDTKGFVVGSRTLGNGTLWIAETLPGTYRTADMTETLRQTGYWGSYNINYFDDLRILSGVQAKADKGKKECCDYKKSSRAQIFDRDAPKVNTFGDMQKMMRMNDPKDKLVKDAGHAIAARFDLVPDVGYDCSGATDAKIASLAQLGAGSLSFAGISSQAYEGRPAFTWSGKDAKHCGNDDDHQKQHHEGLPNTWQFPWYNFAVSTSDIFPFSVAV